VGSPMPRMTPLEPGGDDHSPTYPLKQIVDTAQPLREQPTEPWGNAGRSGPLARPVSHRAPRGRRDGRKSVATPPHGMAFEFAWHLYLLVGPHPPRWMPRESDSLHPISSVSQPS
jgi:hypothetical protein